MLAIVQAAQTSTPYFHVAFHLEVSDKEQDVLRTNRLIDGVISHVEPITAGWPVGKALEGFQDFDAWSMEGVLTVEAALQDGCMDVAATMARLPTLAGQLDGDDDFQFWTGDAPEH